jgi:ABC-2 type transport system ATP-binding protein
VDPLIEVSDLRKSCGDIERLHGISFTVESEEIFGLLGTSGAGKTTTIEILEGFRALSDGQVRLGADPAIADRSWRNRIGLVLQESEQSELNPIYTVRDTSGESISDRRFSHEIPLAQASPIASEDVPHRSAIPS